MHSGCTPKVFWDAAQYFYSEAVKKIVFNLPDYTLFSRISIITFLFNSQFIVLEVFSSPTGTDDRRKQRKPGTSKHFEIQVLTLPATCPALT